MTTPEFIALAESMSGQDLGGLFDTWLYTGAYPAGAPAGTARSAAASSSIAGAPAASRSLYQRYGKPDGVHLGR